MAVGCRVWGVGCGVWDWGAFPLRKLVSQLPKALLFGEGPFLQVAANCWLAVSRQHWLPIFTTVPLAGFWCFADFNYTGSKVPKASSSSLFFWYHLLPLLFTGLCPEFLWDLDISSPANGKVGFSFLLVSIHLCLLWAWPLLFFVSKPFVLFLKTWTLVFVIWLSPPLLFMASSLFVACLYSGTPPWI